MIRLFTTWYREPREDRHAEYLRCLRQNLDCPAIGQVCVFDECSGNLPSHPKLVTQTVKKRPTYKDFFEWINDLSAETDLAVIANTDIGFDLSLVSLLEFDWTLPTAFAVSRWDVQPNGSLQLFDRGDSQDAWIFRGPVSSVVADFPLGVYDCDNKIAWELQQAGYRVLNPALSLRSYHHHQCGYRSYEQKPAPDYGIRPPFLYVEPENLWGPLTAWRISRRLKLPYVPWSMTTRRFCRYPLPALFCRVWNKLTRTVAAAGGRD